MDNDTMGAIMEFDRFIWAKFRKGVKHSWERHQSSPLRPGSVETTSVQRQWKHLTQSAVRLPLAHAVERSFFATSLFLFTNILLNYTGELYPVWCDP